MVKAPVQFSPERELAVSKSEESSKKRKNASLRKKSKPPLKNT